MDYEKYIHTTVRIRFRNKPGYLQDRTGIVQGITATKLILLILDDDEDCEVMIKLSKIEDIKLVNGEL